MEEVRQLVQEEGREARNLVAFHVAVDTPARVSRKPPRALPPVRRTLPRASRLRSASAGRDKRSELRARYWALLFGDLQRAVGEIYNTVESHENLSECQEVILVLENYTRDFKALGEWFRLKWEYDNTPPPHRPQSLAWEIRKTDFVRPESRRTHSVKSSPSVSGKNSPCLSGHNTPSGKNSPNLTGKASPGSGKISPRITAQPSSSPKANIEFFSNKIATSKITAKPEAKIAKESSRLSDIKEKEVKDTCEEKLSKINAQKNKDDIPDKQESKLTTVEIGTVKEYQNVCAKQVIIKSPKHAKSKVAISDKISEDISCQAKVTVAQLNAMESDFLEKQISANQAKNENMINQDIEKGNDKTDTIPDIIIKENIDDKEMFSTESPTKSEDNFADISNESSPKLEVDKNSIDNIEIRADDTPVIYNKSIETIDPINNEKANTKYIQGNGKESVFENVNSLSIDQNEEIGNLSRVKDSFPTINSELKVLNDEILQVIQNTTEFDKQQNKQDIKVEVQMKSIEYIENDIFNGLTAEIPIKDDEKDNKTSSIIESPKDMLTDEVDENKKDHDLKKNDVAKSSIDNKQPVKPAYSQAAAKPKSLNAAKIEVKTPTRLARSSTVVEMRPSTVPKTQRSFQKKHQTNKCSYPFNLTTGRTSLFDTNPTGSTNKGTLYKRPIDRNRNMQLASGDAKPLTGKEVLKKRPPRPSTFKTAERIDKKENSNVTLEKDKDCKDYGTCDTAIAQMDMSRIESSESLKTLVPEDHQVLQDVANSIEVLNVDSNKNDNEGWLTVKSRRLSRESKKHSKSHWANRFHQPSATTSLPTLNMLESPKEEIKEFIDTKVSNVDRAKSEQPQLAEKLDEKIDKDMDIEKVINVPSKPNYEHKTRDPSMIRQKSDVTGLRTKSSRSKVLTKRAERIKDSKQDDDAELTKNRLHSSLESLTTALARSQESTEEVFDFDKWKAEFKSTFKYLEDDDQIPDQNEILKAADPSEVSEIAEMTSQIEENERKISWALDFQSEVDQRKLCEEEDLLNRQILELQQVSDIDIDTETDDTETDAEILSEDPPPQAGPTETLGSLAASLEDQYETALAGMSWAERVDTLVVLEALVARDPGRAQQLHAKLSQGIKRRGSLQDALRRLQAKQARAERQRLEFQTERAKKIHQLLARVEEVKVAKNQLIEEKRIRMERRLQKATENRDQHLKDIVRKAHDEEEKLREIAFIKQLEAENRRHEFLEQCRSHTTRLRQMRRDRLHKLEQKAAREAAVGARRQALEAARRLHVASMLERRKERDARVEELRELRRQERGDAAREKAEGVKSRLSALAAAAELEADALRSRIRDKQDASQQRLESHLQAIREKATGPRQATTSESQDQIPKEVEEETGRQDQERKEREKQKAIKKKARKLKQKLLAAGHSNPIFDDNITTLDTFLNPVTSKVYRVISSIRNIIAPLLRDTKTYMNGVENEEEKSGKKKKGKAVNGDVEAEQKKDKGKNKKGNSDVNSNNEANVNREVKDAIETKPEEPHTSHQPPDKSPEEPEKETKKKNKKKKNSEDKPTLNKASSVCSSMSDMSRGSGRNDRNTKVDLDLPYLEKQMNELYRIMEKFEKQNITEKMAIQRFQAVKVIAQMLAVAAEKEDLNPPISAKCVCTGALLVSRALAACTASAAQLLATNTCVHLATLLARQMDKNLQFDQKEMELAKQLADCLSVALDSVLCASRIHEEQGNKPKEEVDVLVFLRNRAHQIISYLCLSGCITRAEKAGEARESIQTLLTVSADLCHPYLPDIGAERTYAKQALRTALGKSVCGSRAEFCMLFAKGASLGQCGDFVRAARTAHLLRAIAEMDHQIVQEAFGEGGWPLEFRAAVARLFSQHAPNEKEAPRTTALHLSNQRLDQTLSETMVLDLIVLVGFVVVNNPQLQETICEGWSVIKALCTLPANWLVSQARSHALLPTLIALAERPASAAAIASEVSMTMLEEFYESPEAQKIKLIQVIKQGRTKKPPGKK
ncbi:S phase cyclin A-associated protein in the endoplasmic reticulum isoform X1 [Vanessa atalanta]|uniref:S phase cyclin A-associated protein in the endoplasmic reticulum isoform X1 n=1 Tax=Vanessa atalanta TaxID=42275 RepID=UPI001FCDA4B3|nr:S phase cyclin A-associated protein in the endoplasmic reticulum isoform X1 [Vanessa atalanta]